MTPAALAAAVAAGVAVWGIAHGIAQPRRRIAGRVAPYTAVARARLGAPPTPEIQPVLLGEAARRVLGPLTTRLATRAASSLRLTPTADLELKLRQAGQPMTADAYRRTHLRLVLGAPAAFAALGFLDRLPTILTAAFAASGLIFGARHLPEKVRRLTRRRREEIRNDLYSVAQLLAIRAQGKEPLIGALHSLVEAGRGPVIDDLAAALALIADGYGAAAAFTRLADETPEPQAAHFYRLLTTATKGAADLPANLLELAGALRDERRQTLERSTTRRFAAQVIPVMGLMAPVMIVFVSAPIPRAIFGS
jgi:tight adherence protein C